ncbi:YetF domain-containing protein [Virgibacillus xinjiangensis]|uniref:YetF domain-containing protein n=1 Tax=Virgibacillus xinjiangensis TaxID=393090 RepID=A0ABV7CS61_9BACI
MTILELLLRILLAFVTLLILTRLMGRKEISQMTFFNFVSGIAIGTIGASLAIDSSLSVRNGLIALAGWSAITIILGFIDINSKKARVAIEGQPRIVIKQGQIMEDELQNVRLDVDALTALLRQKNIFSLAEVETAIFETSGKLSVEKKQPYQSATKSDMAIPAAPSLYPSSTEVISDGRVIRSNLEKLNLNQDWLEEQLKVSGVQSISDVFYAEVQKDGTLHIDNKSDSVH